MFKRPLVLPAKMSSMVEFGSFALGLRLRLRLRRFASFLARRDAAVTAVAEEFITVSSDRHVVSNSVIVCAVHCNDASSSWLDL